MSSGSDQKPVGAGWVIREPRAKTEQELALAPLPMLLDRLARRRWTGELVLRQG